MLAQHLTIIHRKKPNVFQELPTGWRVFVTCLRSIAMSFSPTDLTGQPGDQLLRGPDAYRFLLEVACGLQSPIVGETEVFGQFRHFAEQWGEHAAFFQNVFADVKAVRQQHLSHLGSASYGSWVRKQVRPGELIHVLGTGRLAQELYIWLYKQNPVCLYSRAPELARERIPEADIRRLAPVDDVNGAVVVVAAPLRASEIEDLFQARSPRLLIDLRDDSSIDRVTTTSSCFRLQDIFAEIEAGRVQAHEKVKQARQMVDALVNKRFQSQVVRPFGWDDLCA